MRMVDVGTLERITRDIFVGWRAPREDASWIAPLLVRADPCGHDSQGVIRIPNCVHALKAGEVNPTQSIKTESETLGQVVARHGIAVAIAKARAQGLSAVTLRRTNHVGRLADYAEILVPGEPEERTSRERRAGGVPIDDETWRQIKECAAEVGVDA